MSAAPTSAEIIGKIQHVQADTAGVMEAARWVEWILANRFQAEGTGIHSRVSAVQHRLAGELVADLRYLASVRNDFAHNPLAEVRQPERFVQTAQRAVRRLLEAPADPQPPQRRSAVAAQSGPRMRFVVAVAGFWAVAAIAMWLYGQLQARDEGSTHLGDAQPARVLAPPPIADHAQPRPASRSATRTAEAAARPASTAARHRPATEPDATQSFAKPEVPMDDAGLSTEELRKLKASL
ncbi:hypothetical protein [Roseateles sp.]|uniref:hypothetical protein n=1 Tax=Roseateles sp. TaxID=1971397 RepID=UPI0039EB4B5F